MSHDQQERLTELLALPLAERGELAAQMIASLDPSSDADAGDAWSTEIADRLRAIDEGRVQMIPRSEAQQLINQTADGTSAD